MQLLTIGYEGLTPDQFFGLLRANDVQTIVDVRELPLSRKTGFSKDSLAKIARENGIKYVHIPALGCPKSIRHAYRIDKNWTRYTLRFITYLNTQDEAIAELTSRVRQERCCLVCFEADPNYCHRLYVAERVSAETEAPLSVIHLRDSIGK